MVASVTLDGNKIVVICSGGRVTTDISVDKSQLGSLEEKIVDAMVYASKKMPEYKGEIGAIDETNAANTLRGQLLAVAPKSEKRVTAPAKAQPAEKAAPTRTDMKREPATPVKGTIAIKWPEWLEARLIKAGSGDLQPVADIYANKSDLNKSMAQFPEHPAAATRTVFAELWKIPAFRLNLDAMAQNKDANGQELSLLSGYVKTYKGLSDAGQDVMNAANVYVRYFLLFVGAAEKPDYARELGQLPRCSKAMDGLGKSPKDLKPLAGHMDSETAIAAALYIRRWNLEQKGVKPDKIPLWQTPETIAAKQAPAVQKQPMARDTIDWSRREIRW